MGSREPVIAKVNIAPACPTPTPEADYDKIAIEIENAIKAGVPPDKLAENWERLEAQTAICRGK